MNNLWLAWLVACRLRWSKREWITLSLMSLTPVLIGLLFTFIVAQNPKFSPYLPLARYMPQAQKVSRVFENTTLCASPQAFPYIQQWVKDTKATVLEFNTNPLLDPQSSSPCLVWIEMQPLKEEKDQQKTVENLSPLLTPPKPRWHFKVQGRSPSAAEWVTYRLFKQQNQYLEAQARLVNQTVPLESRVPWSQQKVQKEEKVFKDTTTSIVKLISSAIFMFVLLELGAMAGMFSALRIEQWRHMGTLEAFSLVPKPLWILFMGQGLHVGLSTTMVATIMMLGMSLVLGSMFWWAWIYLVMLVFSLSLAVTSLAGIQSVIFGVRWWPLARGLMYPISAVLPWVVYIVLLRGASFGSEGMLESFQALPVWKVTSTVVGLLLFAAMMFGVLEMIMMRRRQGLSSMQS